MADGPYVQLDFIVLSLMLALNRPVEATQRHLLVPSMLIIVRVSLDITDQIIFVTSVQLGTSVLDTLDQFHVLPTLRLG
jgi:hypothetical protein